jgi:lactoylglutathione lyase
MTRFSNCLSLLQEASAPLAMFLTLWLGSTAFAQNQIARPRIFGIAHVAFVVNDFAAAQSFYEDTVALEMPFSLKHPNGGRWIDYLKINNQQYVELFNDSTQPNGAFNHIAFYTDDLAGMRKYLLFHGVKLGRDIHQGRTGDAFLSFRDPDGRIVEMVEYKSSSWTAEASKKSNGSSPDHILHVAVPRGFTVASQSFYRDVLGFVLTLGSTQSNPSVRVPEGNDYVEFLPATSQVNESCEIVLSSGKSLCRQP